MVKKCRADFCIIVEDYCDCKIDIETARQKMENFMETHGTEFTATEIIGKINCIGTMAIIHEILN